MRVAAILLVGLGISAVGASAQEPLPDPHYKITWSDEFEGSALNSSLWQYRTDSKFSSTQVADNVDVKNGLLTIHLRKEARNGKPYTGGGVISRKSFRYGYYEARLKIVAGRGWHSSFWMMQYNGGDTHDANIELDAMENDAQSKNFYKVTVHRWLPSHLSSGAKGVSADDLSKFHTFGCEYLPNVVKYYLDGELVHTVDWSGQPQGPVNIWLSSIAWPVGPIAGVDEAALPGEMVVHWVRFYEK